MQRVSLLALCLVAAQALTNTGHYRSFYGYDITDTSTTHTLKFVGKTCELAYTNFVMLNAASSTSDGESLETAAQHYLSWEYPGSKTCTSNSYTTSAIAGDCNRRIIKQDTVTAATLDLGTAVAISSDSDVSSTTVGVYQVQFATDDMESCINTVTVDSHAGHSHRRSGDHTAFSVTVTFPSAGRWFFFSTGDLVGDYEFTIEVTGATTTLAPQAQEVLADPLICSEATTVCDCHCDGDKYMWAGLILLSGLIGFLPIVFKQMASSQKVADVMSLFNCLGGGVLLAVSVSHVFPEALALYPSSSSGDYPLAGMLCVFGYWACLVVDKVLIAMCMPGPATAPSPGPDVGVSSKPETTKDDENPVQPMEISSEPSTGQGHGTGQPEALPAGACQAMGVFLAMSIHSILAGVALGLKCDTTSLKDLGIAIIAHKMFDVSTVGIILVRAEAPMAKALPMVLFVALMTPIGVMIGVAGDNVDNKANGAIQAIASGTFLYVAIQEVLASEFAKPDRMLLKALATLLGISIIALTGISYTTGGHSH